MKTVFFSLMCLILATSNVFSQTPIPAGTPDHIYPSGPINDGVFIKNDAKFNTSFGTTLTANARSIPGMGGLEVCVYFDIGGLTFPWNDNFNYYQLQH